VAFVSTTDTDALIQTVEDRLLALGDHMSLARDEGLAALRALAARLTEYERQTPAWDRLAAQEVRRLEAELERVQERLHKRIDEDSVYRVYDEQVEENQRSKARLDKALAALRRIEACEWQDAKVEDLVQIARAVIAEIEGETWACACVGPPAYDGDPRCVCAREAARSGKPWPRWEHLPPPAEIEGEAQ
jgi:hypothetical protein